MLTPDMQALIRQAISALNALLDNAPPPTPPEPEPSPTRWARTRIGFHLRPGTMGNGRADILEWVDRIRPSTVLVMDDPALAQELHTSFPELTVTCREFKIGKLEFHQNAWQSVTPEEVADYWRRTPLPGIYRYACNEPDSRHPALIEWTVRLIEACGKLGIHADVFQAGSGRWEADEINAGVYDRMLHALDKHREYVRLALHEYNVLRWDVDIEGGTSPYNLAENPNIPVPTIPVRKDRFGWNWLRYSVFNKRADDLNIARPRMVISEWGFDRLTHLTPQLNAFQQATGGLAPYEGQVWGQINNQELCGAQTYRRAWERYYPNRTWEYAYAHQLNQIEPHYADNVEGFTLYMADKTDWRARGFDYWTPPFLAQLEGMLTK